MSAAHVFAGIPVSDLAVAIEFYERLAGRPADLVPNEREAAWQLTDSGWLVVMVDGDHAGSARHTILVDDLDALLAGLDQRGVATAKVELIGEGVRGTRIVDPDGNQLQAGQLPGSG